MHSEARSLYMRRNLAITMALIDTGARPGEILDLRNGDVDREHSRLGLRRTKTDKPRWVPVSSG